jgi:hypothetical protein
MAIPGVTPTQVLMSLDETDDQGNIGAALGYGSQAEKNYRSSLGGQMAPIYGKGGYQYATLAPFNQIFSLDDDTSDDTGSTVPIQRPVTGDGGSSSIFQDAATTAQNIVQNPTLNQTTYGPITGMVQDYIGDANIDVPFVGNVNVPNAVVNTALDTVANFGVPGLGILSTIANPTQVETSWGTPFNTGGGGLIGVFGQASLNNLENIYGETQAGTPGYSFYAPGDLPGTSTPIGISPGLFGYGSVVSGNTDMMPPQADLNNDGIITASEVQAFADPTSPSAQSYAQNQQFISDVQSTLGSIQGSSGITQNVDESGNPAGTTFSSGNLVTDDTGLVVGSLPSGMTFDDFYSQMENQTEPSSSVTTTPDLTTESIVDAIVSGMNNAAANPNVPGTFEVASSGNITSDASSNVTSGGISVGYGAGQVDPGLASAVSSSNGNGNDGGMSSSESAASGGYAESVSGGGEFGGTSGAATSAADYNDKDGTSSSNNDGGGSSGGGGCVIATHGVMTGGFTLMEKAKAELWCQKTYHGKWYGEAFRRGYRAAGQRCIDQGKAREHYQEFKDFVAYGRGVKKGWGLAFKYYMRTIQFFVTGLFIKGD